MEKRLTTPTHVYKWSFNISQYVAKTNNVHDCTLSSGSFLVLTAANSPYAQNEKYRAKLDGNNEVPPINSTAEGVINFKTKNDMLTWKMNVTGANDPTGVNIHKGKAGDDGEIVVDLMKVSKHSDTPKGMIMRGNVTESSLTGSLAGKTIEDLKTAIANGDVYINLKTEDHPDGLMRGQIRSREEITQRIQA